MGASDGNRSLPKKIKPPPNFNLTLYSYCAIMYRNRSFPKGIILPENDNWNCVTARACDPEFRKALGVFLFTPTLKFGII